MTKVVLINLWRVINAYGGAEKVFFSLANELALRGYDVTAIASDSSHGVIHFPISEMVNFKNCIVDDVKQSIIRARSFYFPSKQQRDKKRLMISLQNKAKALKQEIDKVKPDIIISFQQETTFILKEMIRVNQKVITMFHGHPSCYFKGSKFNFYKSSLEESECCQVLLPAYIDELKKSFSPKRSVCIPNAIPQYAQKAPLENKVIISVGRISSEKRQHLLVEAYALLKDKYPDWKVELWGETTYDPIYYEQVRQKVENLHLSSEVLFCGVTNNIEEKLEQASIFVLPSEFEGFPLALGEAMSKGLPAIGCKSCIAVGALIKHGNSGLLCNDSPIDIAEKLETLIKSHQLRLEYGNHAKCEMKAYSTDIVLEKWEKLIDCLLNE